MNTNLLTKAHMFWPLTSYLTGFGVPIGRYIERFRLPKKMLDAPDLFIDESRFWRLAGDLAEREGCLDWGYCAGQQLGLSVLGDFGARLLNRPSLKAALGRRVAPPAPSIALPAAPGRFRRLWRVPVRGRGMASSQSRISLGPLYHYASIVSDIKPKNIGP